VIGHIGFGKFQEFLENSRRQMIGVWVISGDFLDFSSSGVLNLVLLN